MKKEFETSRLEIQQVTTCIFGATINNRANRYVLFRPKYPLWSKHPVYSTSEEHLPVYSEADNLFAVAL